MSGIMNMLLGAKTAIAAAVDEFFNRVTLLLPGDGTNGAQNNTFLDSSSNNFTITRNGNTTQGTFSPFSQTGWSNYFDGTDDYLNLGGQSAFSFGTGDWTIEFWMYFTASSGTLFDTRPSGTSSTNGYGVLFLSSSSVRYDTASGTKITGSTLSANTWYHVALSKASGVTRLFINGTQDGSSYTDSVNYGVGANRPIIGADGNSPTTVEFTGYLSNYRILKGTGLYTTTFTPPTSTLENITNTSLLTCQSNRFVDNSTANSGSGFTITVNSTPSVQAFSPFAPTAAYSTSTNGGSGYFDGTGDYLTVANNAAFQFGSGNFTIECFVYATSLPAEVTLISKWNAGGFAGSNQWLLYLASGTPTFIGSTDGSAVAFTATGPSIVANSFNHIAVTRNGNSVTVYTNGVAGTPVTYSGTLYSSETEVLGISYRRNNGSTLFPLTGYMSGIRIVKGQSLSTGAFTPPTAPVTTSSVGWTGANVASSITGTISLLCGFTNAGITDATAKNDLETVGNAQISTTQSKFGGSSISLNGTTDILTIAASNPIFAVQNGAFTLEAWIYMTANNSVSRGIVSNRNAGSSSNGFSLSVDSSNKLKFEIGNNATSNSAVGSTSLVLNTWYHVAAVLNGTAMTVYLNGVSDGTTTRSVGAITLSKLVVGRYWYDSNSEYFGGYIDDLRISNFARYTTNFTAPTSTFPIQ